MLTKITTATLILTLVTVLSACADLIGIVLNVEPGQTASLVSASSRQVTYEYTHSYSRELSAVGQKADGECSKYGKHAELGKIVRQSLDRSIATFNCN